MIPQVPSRSSLTNLNTYKDGELTTLQWEQPFQQHRNKSDHRQVTGVQVPVTMNCPRTFNLLHHL